MKGHTLVLAGELDRVSAPVLETEIERLCVAGVNSLTLDVRALSTIDSAGVAVIVHRSGWCARHGCRLSLLADEGPARRALAEAGARGRVELVSAPETATELVIGAQEEQEPARALAARAQLVRPNSFAAPGKVALAAATGHGGGGEARSAWLPGGSGRWARAGRARRARRR